MTTTQDNLMTALRNFLNDAIMARDAGREGGAVIEPALGVETLAARLMALPSAEAANVAASETAMENGYLLRESPARPEARAAGRSLSANALVETGVAGMLLSDSGFDLQALAAELAGYLAGPAVPIWDYAILDADVTLSGPVPVVDGWELVTPTREGLAGLVGVPSAARYVARRTLDPDLYGGLAMLRRIDPTGKPRTGLVVYFGRRPAHPLWQPMLTISLYQNPVVHLWAQYDVEPGRRIDVLFDHVYTEPWTPDGETEVEVVRQGDYEVDAAGEPRLRRFLKLVAAARRCTRAAAEVDKGEPGTGSKASSYRRAFPDSR